MSGPPPGLQAAHPQTSSLQMSILPQANCMKLYKHKYGNTYGIYDTFINNTLVLTPSASRSGLAARGPQAANVK